MTANEITSGLLIELPKRFKCRAWRVNTGAGKLEGGRFVRFNHPGMADISGVIDPGLRLEIEVKANGDRLTKQQESFLMMVERYGGIALVARDVDTTLIAIQNAIDFKTALHLATVAR